MLMHTVGLNPTECSKKDIFWLVRSVGHGTTLGTSVSGVRISHESQHVLITGLTGFDGKMRWYVSMRRLVCYLLNLSEQQLIGERNYALAA